MIYYDSPQNLATHIEKVSKRPLSQFANLPELFLEVVDGFEKNGDVASLVGHREEVRLPSRHHLLVACNSTCSLAARLDVLTPRLIILTVVRVVLPFLHQADRMRQADSTRQASFSTKAADEGAAPSSYANNVIAESLILLDRNARIVIRTPELFFVRTALCVVIGLVLGSLFLNVDDNQSGISKRLGYIAFLEAFFIFTSLEALPIFLSERAIFIRYSYTVIDIWFALIDA